MSSFDPSSTYVCLAPDGSASPIAVTPSLWDEIDGCADLQEGRLVAVFESSADRPYWEMHPNGEEILVLLSGTMTMVFEERGGEREIALREGHACIVPRGTWHRASDPAERLRVRSLGSSRRLDRASGIQLGPTRSD